MTAVEWLDKEMKRKLPCILPDYIIDEALEMEKQQKGYTEEQVRQAFMKGVSITGEGYNAEYCGGNDLDLEKEFGEKANEFIKLLKQS